MQLSLLLSSSTGVVAECLGITMPCFYVASGDLNSGPQACTANTLLITVSPGQVLVLGPNCKLDSPGPGAVHFTNLRLHTSSHKADCAVPTEELGLCVYEAGNVSMVASSLDLVSILSPLAFPLSDLKFPHHDSEC